MKKDDQRQLDDNFIEQKIAEAFGYTEDQLSEELDRFMEEAEKCQEEIPDAPEGEFQRILDRAKAEMKGQRKSGHRVRRLIKVMAAAAIIGTMVFGGGIWVGARRTKEYYTTGRSDIGGLTVLDNSLDNLILSNDEKIQKAYAQIKELNIQVLELSYVPDKLSFCGVTILNDKAIMEFTGEETDILFYQSVNNNTSSFGYITDMEEAEKIYNSFLDKEIPIYKQRMENGKNEYRVLIVEENSYYILEGAMEEKEFEQIVCGLKIYGN